MNYIDMLKENEELAELFYDVCDMEIFAGSKKLEDEEGKNLHIA